MKLDQLSPSSLAVLLPLRIQGESGETEAKQLASTIWDLRDSAPSSPIAVNPSVHVPPFRVKVLITHTVLGEEICSRFKPIAQALGKKIIMKIQGLFCFRNQLVGWEFFCPCFQQLPWKVTACLCCTSVSLVPSSLGIAITLFPEARMSFSPYGPTPGLYLELNWRKEIFCLTTKPSFLWGQTAVKNKTS